MTAPAIDEFILPHLYFTQYLADWFAVVIGKLDATGGDANEFAHGRGDDKFMNLAFSFNPVVISWPSIRTTTTPKHGRRARRKNEGRFLIV